MLPRTTATRMLLGILGALEDDYDDLRGHGEMVAEYCTLMAEELGLPAETVEELRLAGALHDIGKLEIDEATLLRRTPLSEDEWTQIRRHPEVGAEVLRQANLDRIAAWVLAHHERPDGNGYPLGLKAGEIPIEAKILAVADAYDAMITDRVYRHAMSAEDAARELLQGADEQFDREAVEALLTALDRNRADGAILAEVA